MFLDFFLADCVDDFGCGVGTLLEEVAANLVGVWFEFGNRAKRERVGVELQSFHGVKVSLWNSHLG